MTPTRLRQIADQLERACIEKRKLLHFFNGGSPYVACDTCRSMADELRAHAIEIGKAKGAAA